jgi:SsrA-binding protein
MKILSVNKKINLNYQIIDSYEAGLSLRGTEVKSIMLGNFSIEESFAHIDKKNEIYIFNMYIAPFFCDCNKEKYISTRKRKLLLHKKEIMKINIILKKNRRVLIPT